MAVKALPMVQEMEVLSLPEPVRCGEDIGVGVEKMQEINGLDDDDVTMSTKAGLSTTPSITFKAHSGGIGLVFGQ